MHSDFHLQFCPSVRLDTNDEDWLITRGLDVRLRQLKPGPAARALLQSLADSGGRADKLIVEAQAAEPNAPGANLYFLLHALEQRGLLSYGLVQGSKLLATLEPMTQGFHLLAPVPDPAARYRLSRFAILRRDGEYCLVESPLGHARLRLYEARLAAMAADLAKPQTSASLAAVLPDLTPANVAGLIRLLMSLGGAFVCDEAGLIAEDHAAALRQWEAHDLVFHTRSRLGRHDYPLGGTFRYAGKLPHAPALKPPGPGKRIVLPRPVATPVPNPSQTGPNFFAVLEARRSIRQAGTQPLTINQLGILLWHVARVQVHRPADPNDPKAYEATLRPVPGGGAMHELELYLTVTRCSGLEPGLYRYDPGTHTLEWVAATSADSAGLLRDAMRAAAMETPPDVLITLAARFARMAWKYEGMAYAAILKHVGVLYQQLYLVATALGLAPCALGAGDSQRFAAAAGTLYYEEASVGEFALSGPPQIQKALA